MNDLTKVEQVGYIRSRAPVRVDLAGGWTDVSEFCQVTPGAVINISLALYSHVTLTPRHKNHGHVNNQSVAASASNLKSRGELVEEGVSIYSSDFDKYVEASSIRDLEYDGNVDLVKAAMRTQGVSGGFDLVTSSSAPPGSGLGTSAAMGVALLACLCRYDRQSKVAYELAEEASRIEREELGIRGGKQDHYASALGGALFLEFHGHVVQASHLPLSRSTLLELESNLIVAYTGESRLSGQVHSQVAERYHNGDSHTVTAIENLKTISRTMKRALMADDWQEVGSLINANWECQKQLHSATSTERIEELLTRAKQEGALGGKACGAGGGGCVAILSPPSRVHHIRRMLESLEANILESTLDYHGVEAWEAGYHH